MNELPKSVREELARQQAAGSHPDADLLTAYFEGTTTSAERASVERHLASCSDCRETVFLAAPPQEATRAVAATVSPTRKRWFALWVPVAATAVILFVATFTFTSKRLSRPASQLAKMEQQQTSTYIQPAPTTGDSSTGAIKNAPATLGTDRTPAATPREKKATEPSVNTGALDRADAERQQTEQLHYYEPPSDQLKTPPKPPPTASAPITEEHIHSARRAASAGAAAPAQKQTQNQQNLAAGNVPPATSTVEVQAQAPPVQTAKAETQITAETLGYSAKKPPATRFRITTAGTLERMTPENTWTTALAQPGTKLTVVATIGPIVWAGGTHGALLRSLDGGSNWDTIHLPNVGDATITKLEFLNGWEGTVTASNGHSWTTTDRGEKWQQQH